MIFRKGGAMPKYRNFLFAISSLSLFVLPGCFHECDCGIVDPSENSLTAIPEIVSANSEDCYYVSEHVATERSMAPNVGAVRIHSKSGVLFASYPTKSFQAKLEKARTQEALVKLVAKASDSNFDNIGEPFLPSPLDFKVSANSYTVFKLQPQNWTFADEGFRLPSLPVARKSPFSVLKVSPDKKTALVEFDNSVKTPKGCNYKYDIPVLSTHTTVTSDGTTRKWETKIIIDPIINNNGGPPGGPD